MNAGTSAAWSTGAALAAILLAGCQNLPGTSEEQGAVAGGAAGAVAGEEVVGGTLGTLLGGALGAAGGYLVGGEYDRLAEGEANRDEAIAAAENAQRSPADPEDVDDADTADLNDDGYVTTDELVAMSEAGLDDDDMLQRLRATDQVFALSQEQKEGLVDAGVSRSVVDELEDINRDDREQLLEEGGVISAPAE